MLDDLRPTSDEAASYYKDDEVDIEALLEKKPAKRGGGFSFNSQNFLGMNAFQRFVISGLLFLVSIILGVMLLLVTGSIALF